MKRALLLCLIFFIALSSFALDLQKIEELVFEYTNAQRSKFGLYRLKEYEGLNKTARYHSGNMAGSGFFSHTDQHGLSPQERAGQLLPGLLGGIGENIAYVSGSDEKTIASDLLRSWMNSEGHRANILSSEYTHLGVGVSLAGERVYATQNFGNLVAELTDAIPQNVNFGDKLSLNFKYLNNDPKESITIYIIFPDRAAKYFLPSGRYYEGLGLYEPRWVKDTESFSIDVKFDKGHGIYSIVMGNNGNYFPYGINIDIK
jgi:hypothetical protein